MCSPRLFMHVCHELIDLVAPLAIMAYPFSSSLTKYAAEICGETACSQHFSQSQCATQPITSHPGSTCCPSIAVAIASSRVLLGQSTASCGPRQMRQRRGRLLLGAEFVLSKPWPVTIRGWWLSFFFEKWLNSGFEWLGVARGGFLWLF